jgi:hypothetical protein
MTDAQFKALITFLIELRAENLAIRKILQSNQIGDAGMDALIQEQKQRMAGLIAISRVLQTGGESQLPTFLDSLAALGPK